jgi:hypothetical protein
MMMCFCVVWYVMLLCFIFSPGIMTGRVMLVLAGLSQSLSMVPMAVMLLHGAGAKFRGRVMGVRMLAIYGLPVGLLFAGWLIPRFGFIPIATAYCIVGALLTLGIGVRWRKALWPLSAAANAR